MLFRSDADTLDRCSGTANTCVDAYQASTFECRADAGQCDVAELCTGSSGLCPANVFEANTVSCLGGSQSGACDADTLDRCSGTANTCVDAYQASTFECRAATDLCDVAENCTGTTAACPGDAIASSGAACRASAGACDDGATCTGLSKVCPPNVYTCSVAGNVVYYRDSSGAGSEPSIKPVSGVSINLTGFASGTT